MTGFALFIVNVDPTACTTWCVAISQREGPALSSDAVRPIRTIAASSSLAALMRSTRACYEQSTCLGNDKTP